MTNRGVEVPEPPLGEPGQSVRELLALDLSLAPSDRRILERVLLDPAAVSARELARLTGANPQSLYVALDRLERRGLIVREKASGGTRYRSGHPSAVLYELLRVARRAGELAERVETPLRSLHEARPDSQAPADTELAYVASSLTASIGAALRIAPGLRSGVWVVGDERPWVGSSSTLEQMLLAPRPSVTEFEVRVLVRPTVGDARRLESLRRLARVGAVVRTAPINAPAMLLLDRRWAFVRSASEVDGRTATASYLHLDAPELVAELIRGLEAVWGEATRVRADPSVPVRAGGSALPRMSSGRSTGSESAASMSPA